MFGLWILRDFGDFATPEWGVIKSSENYERRFVMTFPNETLPKGKASKNNFNL